MAQDLYKEASVFTKDLIDVVTEEFQAKAQQLVKEHAFRIRLRKEITSLPELNQEESASLLETTFGPINQTESLPFVDTKPLPGFLLQKMRSSGQAASVREANLSNPNSQNWSEYFAKSATGRDLFLNISTRDGITSFSVQAVNKLPASLIEFQNYDASKEGSTVNFILDPKGQLVRATLTTSGKEALIPKSQHEILVKYLAHITSNSQLNIQLHQEENDEFWRNHRIKKLADFEEKGAVVDFSATENTNRLAITINGKTFEAIGDRTTPRSELFRQIEGQQNFPASL